MQGQATSAIGSTMTPLRNSSSQRLKDYSPTATTRRRSSCGVLSSRLYDLGDDHELELARRNYRAVQAALERVQAEELRRDAGATQAELDDLTDVEGSESEDEGEEVMLPGSTQSPPAQADADDDGGLDRNALPTTQSPINKTLSHPPTPRRKTATTTAAAAAAVAAEDR